MKHKTVQTRQPGAKRYGIFLLFIVAMASLGFLAQIQWVGSLIVIAYIIVATWRRMSPRSTYLLAYAALVMVAVGVLIANWVAAQNFAAYAFLLFVGGVIQTTVELKRQYSTS